MVLFHIQDSGGNEDFSDFITCSEPGILKITQNSLAPPILQVGEDDIEFMELTFYAIETDIHLEQFTLTGKGTFTDEDIDSINLYLDDGIEKSMCTMSIRLLQRWTKCANHPDEGNRDFDYAVEQIVEEWLQRRGYEEFGPQ